MSAVSEVVTKGLGLSAEHTSIMALDNNSPAITGLFAEMNVQSYGQDHTLGFKPTSPQFG